MIRCSVKFLFKLLLVSALFYPFAGHAKELNSSAHFYARQAQDALRKQGGMPAGVSEDNFFQSALFIEKKLCEYIKRKEYFIEKEKSGLCCALEYDPQTRKTFILLPECKENHIGQGCHKVVKKALLYHRKKPEIVARAYQEKITKTELHLSKYLGGCPGLMEVVACTKYALYTKFYNQNSLHAAVVSHRKFTFSEKVQIALGVLTGLKELHKKGIAHRDISLKNCLLTHETEGSSESIFAVLCDFGRAQFINKSFKKGMRVQGHLPNTPPEGIFYENMQGKDFFKSDLFAAGTILYQLFYEVGPPWKNSKYMTALLEPAQSRYEKYVQAIKQHLDCIQTRINNEKQLTTAVAFELLLLQLCDPDPKKRGTASEHYRTMKELYKQVGADLVTCYRR